MQGYKVDRRGTLEMKLTLARTASKYARTKVEREKAAKVAEATEAKLRALDA